VTDGVCKSEAVDTPRHIDVGEDDFDVFSGFEQRDGFIGTTSLERIEPCFFQNHDCVKTDQQLILNDENHQGRHHCTRESATSLAKAASRERGH
jgi:hypothetical protein